MRQLCFLLLEYRASGRLPTTAFASGALAGLAAVTPGSGYMNAQLSMVVGVLGGQWQKNPKETDSS